MSEPLVCLPEEVWEIILNNLEDSADVWSVFRAFPRLDNSSILQKKKPLWLFGLVIPILIPCIKNMKKNTRMLRSCRQTCRHWSTAVDTFLENQPQLRAYEHRNKVPGRFPWDPSWVYAEKWENEMEIRVNKWSCHIGGVKFHNFKLNRSKLKKSVSKFLEAFRQHPQERNPILSRTLSLTVGSGWGDDMRRVAREIKNQFWNDTMAIHQKFGKHVSFYKLQFGNLYELDSGNYFVECLAQLPNLKSLDITGTDDIDLFHGHDIPDCSPKFHIFMERLKKELPPSPQLESLKLDGGRRCKHLGHFLIKHYTAQAQIRRLELEFTLWRPEYSHLFPKLTELDLIEIEWNQVGVIKSILHSLEAPQLSKLQLKFCEVKDEKYLESCEVGMEDDVFQWLMRFPMLKSFILGKSCEVLKITENGTLSSESDSIKSLQFLSIRTSFGMSFKFLQCLPSLQHLRLFIPVKPVVIDHSTNPVVRIWEELQTGKIYKSNIWEMLPKLKTVELRAQENPICWGMPAVYEYCREDYEKTKRAAATSPMKSDVNFSRLRKDILSFLKRVERETKKKRDDFESNSDSEESSDECDSDDFEKRSSDGSDWGDSDRESIDWFRFHGDDVDQREMNDVDVDVDQREMNDFDSDSDDFFP